LHFTTGLHLVLALNLGLTTSAMAGDSLMNANKAVVQIEAQQGMVIVAHPGTDLHDGIRIVLSFRTNSLVFSGSGLKEHPEIILPRFAGDLHMFSHFSVSVAGLSEAILSAHLKTTKRSDNYKAFTIGPITTEDLNRLTDVLATSGIEVRKIKTLFKMPAQQVKT